MRRWYQQGNIVFASAIADHSDGHRGKGFEQFCQHIGGAGKFVAHDRYDSMALFHFDDAERFQLADDGFQIGAVLDRERDGNLGGGDHIYRGTVFFEHLEYFAQESVSQEHAAAADIDRDDPVLGCDGLDAYGTGGLSDERAFRRGLHGVQQPDGHFVELRRPDARGVKDLRPEISELRGLFKTELIDGEGLFDDTGVIVVHPVDVGPYLANGGVDRCGDQ